MQSKDKKILDSLFEIAAEEAFKQEVEALLSCEKMNLLHQPSVELDKRVNKLISKQQAVVNRKKILRYIRYTAAGIAILFISMITLLLSVEASRNYIFNTIIEWREGHTIINFRDSHKEPSMSTYLVTHYLPETFSMVQSNVSDYSSWYLYENENGKQILVSVDLADSANILVDNEGADFFEIIIKGQKMYLFEAHTQDNMSILIGQYDKYVIQITANVETSEIIKIAESFLQ